jgi:predicted nuclease of predicted toxin-antitoxin system
MKLLFDHNLSHKLVRRLADIFPDSTQTRSLGFSMVDDTIIWNYAKNNGFVIVTLDRDFADLSSLRGSPPKIIWLRCGNSTVAEVEQLLRANQPVIENFGSSHSAKILEIWP